MILVTFIAKSKLLAQSGLLTAQFNGTDSQGKDFVFAEHLHSTVGFDKSSEVKITFATKRIPTTISNAIYLLIHFIFVAYHLDVYNLYQTLLNALHPLS